jgi:hypothetical protein
MQVNKNYTPTFPLGLRGFQGELRLFLSFSFSDSKYKLTSMQGLDWQWF